MHRADHSCVCEACSDYEVYAPETPSTKVFLCVQKPVFFRTVSNQGAQHAQHWHIVGAVRFTQPRDPSLSNGFNDPLSQHQVLIKKPSTDEASSSVYYPASRMGQLSTQGPMQTPEGGKAHEKGHRCRL